LQNFWAWEVGDKIECFESVKKTLTLEQSRAAVAVDLDATMAQLEQDLLAPSAEAPAA